MSLLQGLQICQSLSNGQFGDFQFLPISKINFPHSTEKVTHISSQYGKYLTHQNQITDWFNAVYSKKISILAPTAKNNALFKENHTIIRPQKNCNQSSFHQKNQKMQTQSDAQDKSEENEKQDEQTCKIQLFPSEKHNQYLSLIKQTISSTKSQSNSNFTQTNVDIIKENYHQIHSLVLKLIQSDVKIIKNPLLNSEIQLEKISEHGNYEIVEVTANLGPFSKKIKIYNLVKASCFHAMKPLSKGSYGKIYECNYLEQQFVVKCIERKVDHMNQYQDYEKLREQETFKKIIKEYVITCVAGILDLGPKVLNPFGFDIVMSSKCAEFFIEKCEVAKVGLQNLESSKKQLRDSLFQLHLMKIVHNDIKPDNIMYSKKCKRLIFIDFGLSEYLLQPIGYKKKTAFLGTYQYCSPQVQKLYLVNQAKYVDLYYNDIYGLNLLSKAKINLKQLMMRQIPLKDQEKNYQSLATHCMVLLKYYIWTEDAKNAIKVGRLMEVKAKPEFQSEIFYFIQKHLSLPNFALINEFFHTLEQIILEDSIENQQKKNQNSYLGFQELFKRLQLQGEKKHPGSNYPQKFNFANTINLHLKEKSRPISYESACSLFLDYVNFFKNNRKSSIEEKSEVGQNFLQNFSVEKKFCQSADLPIDQLFKPILECLYHMLNYCFDQPLNSWKKQNCAQILLTMAILGWIVPKKTLQKWRYFILSSCYDSQPLEIIFHQYLKFWQIKKITQVRAFMFENDIRLKQLEKKIDIYENFVNLDDHSWSLYDFYTSKQQYFLNQKVQTDIYFLMTDVFEMEESKNITKQKFYSLFSKICQLKNQHFEDISIYNEVTSQLASWCYRKGEKQGICILKVIHLIQGYRDFENRSIEKEVRVHHFEVIELFFNETPKPGKRKMIANFDDAINCKSVSENFLIGQRLILMYEENDVKGTIRLFETLVKYKMKNANDAYLCLKLAWALQQCLYLNTANVGEAGWVKFYHNYISDAIERFIQFFSQNPDIWKDQDCRSNFADIVVRFERFLPQSLLIALKKNPDPSPYKDYFYRLLEKSNFQLGILKKVIKLYPEPYTKVSLIGCKLSLSQKDPDFDHEELRKELEEEMRVIYLYKSDGTINTHYVRTYVNYYSYCLYSDGKYESKYRQKIVELYYKLIEEEYAHFIFKEYEFCNAILQYSTPKQLKIHFLETLTHVVTYLPNFFCFNLYFRYIQHFMKMQRQAFDAKIIQKNYQTLQPKNSLQPISMAHSIYRIFDLSKYFNDIPKFAYLIMGLYVIAFEYEFQLERMRNFSTKIVLILPFVNKLARDTIFIRHYGFFLEQMPLKSNRKRHIISRKLMKSISNLDFFKIWVGKVKIRKPVCPDGIALFRKGLNRMKAKQDNYYKNSNISEILFFQTPKST